MKLRLIVATVVALLSGSGVNPVAHPALAASRCVGGPGCYATTPLALNAADDGDAIQIGKGTVAGSAIITKSAASTLTRRLMLPAVVSLVALGSTRPAVAGALPLLPHQPQIILYPAGTKLHVTDPYRTSTRAVSGTWTAFRVARHGPIPRMRMRSDGLGGGRHSRSGTASIDNK